MRGPRGVVVPLPGQVDPTYVAPDVLERLEKGLEEEADGCAQWLQDLLEVDPLPMITTATHDCFSMRPPHFNASKGEPSDRVIVRAQASLDLGSYYFFKVNFR